VRGAARFNPPAWGNVSLTKQQWDLLVLLASKNELAPGGLFRLIPLNGGRGLLYLGGFAVPIGHEDADFHQLEREQYLTLTGDSEGQLRGALTELGITKGQRMLFQQHFRNLTIKPIVDGSPPYVMELLLYPKGHARQSTGAAQGSCLSPRAARYREKCPLLDADTLAQLDQRGVQRDDQLTAHVESIEAHVRERNDKLCRVADDGERRALEDALQQGLSVYRDQIISFAATAAAQGVREFAHGLLVSQNRLGIHSNWLRGYSGRLVADLRATPASFQVFQTAPLPPWRQDPIAQNAIQRCEEILSEMWKLGDGRPYGGTGEFHGIDLTWSPLVQDWEEFKSAENIEPGPHERIPESILRTLLSHQHCLYADKITCDQISRAGEDLTRHYGSVLVIPLEWEAEDPPKPTPESIATSQFWKEREDEFRKHDTPENHTLSADWFSLNDVWVFRAGSAEETHALATEQIFKSLAREAAKGLNGKRSAEPWLDWLDALRRAVDRSTGKFLYSEVSATGTHSVPERMIKSGEPIPPRALLEFVALGENNDKGGQVDAPPDQHSGTIEKRMFWDITSEKLEHLFAISANFCLELRSLVPRDAPINAERSANIDAAAKFVPLYVDEVGTEHGGQRSGCSREMEGGVLPGYNVDGPNPGHPQADGMSDELLRRQNLLSRYKQATGNPSNNRIYKAKNSGIHKPEFYAWLSGDLPATSQTSINFERFLAEKKPPIPRNPTD